MNTLPFQIMCLVCIELAPPPEFTPAPDARPLQPAAAGVGPAQPMGEPAAVPPSDEALPPSRDAGERTSRGADEPPGQPQQPDVVSAGGQSSLVPVHSSAAVSLAASLLGEALVTADRPPSQAEDMSLLEAIRQASDSAAKQRAVMAYWRLSVAIGRCQFSREEAEILSQIPKPDLAPEGALLAAAKSSALARWQEAELAVTEAQYDLAEQSMTRQGGALPWPTDLPLVGPYRTNFETLFAGRAAPLRLQRIHGLLPVTLQVIERRAQAVSAGRDAVDQASKAYQERQVPLRVLLGTLNQWRVDRQAFLSVILRYNTRIAEYSVAIIGPLADPATLVSTLIKRQSRPAAQVVDEGEVRQASAEAPVLREASGLLRSAAGGGRSLESAPPRETKSVLKGPIRVEH